ncbi:GTP-binding protein HflX [Halopolyspora algeriensis]|uniref:GTPase HflX n=1 Tax=Halopolyspora algeriensis TaxID=1500506 RepID=A0A368VSB4_9ACTN|nr:GTPase HflX [Halopolyspora algeriensis]RCW44015.1 GTP-binding protein HflX [Halopolyspora algeriensis]TQM53482.1 GTP-binding protein HflX [Halopolyspora algeriensis]
MNKPVSQSRRFEPTGLEASELEVDTVEEESPDGVGSSGDPSIGELERAERASLRRVPGLSTELSDVTEVEYRRLRLERVVLVGVWTDGDVEQAEASLSELAQLAETAGSEVLEGVVQRRDRPDPATYVGAGKVRELRDIVAATGADSVICDGELAPGQLRQLEEKTKVKVIDRTALILDIFAQHASSKEGKAQVELAQLQYYLPRLRGWGDKMSRQAGGRAGGGNGGVGTRGPGETKLEIDRRSVHKRITKLRKELASMRTIRDTKRARRTANAVPSVVIAGYTNAGKSSLLNALTGTGVLVEDALFATLDPTTRRARTPDRREYTLSDTVGFVRHLPHQLVEAFRSTLEEVSRADLLLHIVDGSDPAPQEQVTAVRDVLTEISDEHGAPMPSELLVVNKTDSVDATKIAELRRLLPNAVFVSAQTGQGIESLREVIADRLPRPDVFVDALVPYSRGELVSRVHSEGELVDEEHTADGTRLRAKVRVDLAHALKPFAGAG